MVRDVTLIRNTLCWHGDCCRIPKGIPSITLLKYTFWLQFWSISPRLSEVARLVVVFSASRPCDFAKTLSFLLELWIFNLFFWVFHSIFEEFFMFSNRAGPYFCMQNWRFYWDFCHFRVNFCWVIKTKNGRFTETLSLLLEFWFFSWVFSPLSFFSNGTKRLA